MPHRDASIEPSWALLGPAGPVSVFRCLRLLFTSFSLHFALLGPLECPLVPSLALPRHYLHLFLLIFILPFPFSFGALLISWALLEPSLALFSCFTLPLASVPLNLHHYFFSLSLTLMGPHRWAIAATSMPHRCHIDDTSMPHRRHIDAFHFNSFWASIHIDATSMPHRSTSMPHRSTSMQHRCHIPMPRRCHIDPSTSL